MLILHFRETMTGPTVDPGCQAENEKASRKPVETGLREAGWTQDIASQSYANGIILYATFVAYIYLRP
jgi:hypothetical protein